MTPAVRAVVVDDQAMIRAGFSALLSAQDGVEVVGQAADGAEAVRVVTDVKPDVVLMDVRMPVLDGLEATRRILAADLDPPPRVLVLTTFDVDDYVFSALQAGASGFLLKDATPEALVDAVRAVAAGDQLLSPVITRRLIEHFVATRQRAVQVPAAVADLTPREREVLVCVARGLSNTEIAAELFIAEQTTKTHVSRILTKLGLRDRVQAVVLGYEIGLVSPGR
ncbi:response regulator transcription factor [Kineococcus aurantiacus]|uniref:DNA-binding NarL/FixJ family response regulator n=1 Tax=Kineococcus aurantiacus TaxID=37633 RepID=A0A7Y9J2E3_9ACTN|nr:DNA-binding NarL/FixJ family response regulator [Kineococcus aurantiacus]